MSAFLNFNGNQGVTFKNHGTGGGTSFTLDKSASTNSVLLTIGGVMQATGTDYTVSGTTITTTTSVTSGIEVLSWIIHKPGTAPVIQDNSIDSDHYVDGSIDSAHIGNDQIDSQHYAAASIDNEHLADDAVGVAELSATGTASSSTFLRGDNAWAAPGGGAWELLTRGAQSSSASTLDVFDSGDVWKNYDVIRINLLRVRADGSTGSNMTDLRMRISLDASSVYTSTHYHSVLLGRNDAGDALTVDVQQQGYVSMTENSGTATGWSGFGYVDIVTMEEGSGNAHYQGNFNYWDGAAWEMVHFGGYLGQSTGAAQTRGAQFYHPSLDLFCDDYSVVALKKA